MRVLHAGVENLDWSLATIRSPNVRLVRTPPTRAVSSGALDGNREVASSARICISAATANVPATPTTAIKTPASDGPTTRVAFCPAALSETALARSRRRTSDGTIAVPSGPGIGVVPVADRLRRASVHAEEFR